MNSKINIKEVEEDFEDFCASQLGTKKVDTNKIDREVNYKSDENKNILKYYYNKFKSFLTDIWTIIANPYNFNIIAERYFNFEKAVKLRSGLSKRGGKYLNQDGIPLRYHASSFLNISTQFIPYDKNRSHVDLRDLCPNKNYKEKIRAIRIIKSIESFTVLVRGIGEKSLTTVEVRKTCKGSFGVVDYNFLLDIIESEVCKKLGENNV